MSDTTATTATTTVHGGGRQRVVVLGAGYAGLMATLRLAPHHDVTLVAPDPDFTERVRLHELAAGRRASVGHPLARLLAGTGVRHLAARATALDPAARAVTTDGGRTLPYDRLVYALGSHTPAPAAAAAGSAPADPARPGRVYTAETAAALRERLRADRPGRLTVVGGGLTGVEMTAELAEAHPEWRVGLVTAGQVGPGLSERGRTHVLATLRGLAVRVEEGRHVASADEVDADAVVWAGPPAVHTGLAAAAGLALDAAGRIRVDPALRSVSHPEILAAGDAAAGLRMACATALPMGAHAAATVLAEACGGRPRPLRFRYVIQCLSLGRQDGLVQFVHADDSPRERVLTGRAAAWTKERIVRSAYGVLRLAASRPGLVRYVPGVA
ncbi:FAD-dependent oxidoreductase [Streptomyces sp. B1866]|uniref:NAD(P)/FAD-dependent oxidoreductase n=1 Tax=Streptomyces sp. B1866 TaxID=3075431 RepID=UPI0028909DFA|nr:FAD-dependent oxidoreductase [Streptomyces sp. B1866]MDT3398494.1 FAD-dependent oxidoreductase [Streptomyces sp. B1866]